VGDSLPFLWSYAGLTLGPAGALYVTNEASGIGTADSLFVIDPISGDRTLLAANLVSPEGLRFGPGGDFPLYVVEEDSGDGSGKLSRVEANGTHLPVCTGFQSIEDVLVDQQGRLFVSEDGRGRIILIEAAPPARTPAQAIILFIGDGMGEAHRTAARWSVAGQSGALAMDRLPAVGWSRTANAGGAVTDSAAGATAIATGVKTNNGVVGMDPDGNSLTTILEQAQARGMAVGLVTTTQMAHATPAAFAAHVPSRYQMIDIAGQMLANEVDVLLGGGEDEFLPLTVTGAYPQVGKRTDGRNLIDEAIAAGYTYVYSATALAAVDPGSTPRLLGLFADEGLPRPHSPSLAEMTGTAIDILSQDPDGFFLLVEGGQIDWAAHDNDAATVISDTLAFDQAVAVAQSYALTATDTLIIVTADHETGGMSVSLASSGLPDEDGPFLMPAGTPFHVNWSSIYHSSADVPVTAQGPWSQLLAGTYENTHLYRVMSLALNPNLIALPIILGE
jgi:alkaline phosphatase